MPTQYPEWARRARAARDLRKEVEAKLDRVYLEALDGLYATVESLDAELYDARGGDTGVRRIEFTGDVYGDDMYDSLILWFGEAGMQPMNYKRIKPEGRS